MSPGRQSIADSSSKAAFGRVADQSDFVRGEANQAQKSCGRTASTTSATIGVPVHAARLVGREGFDDDAAAREQQRRLDACREMDLVVEADERRPSAREAEGSCRRSQFDGTGGRSIARIRRMHIKMPMITPCPSWSSFA